MKKYRGYIFLILFNIIFSMTAVFLNPRFDIVTLFYFILINIFLFYFLYIMDRKKQEETDEKIDKITEFLHRGYEADFEVEDESFSKLKDEISKIIAENKNIADISKKNHIILKEYLEDITHQIKTPLTGIILMTDMIEDDSKNAKKYSYHIRKNINRLYHLSDILLKMSSLDSGVIEMKIEKTDLEKLMFEVKESVESYFAKDVVRVKNCRIFVNCDRKWTFEAIFNIVKNAVEASDGKDVIIEGEDTNIYTSIRVRDFSKGMTDEMLKKAFKRFEKDDKNSKGYGIGLPMADSIIKRQDGEILYFREDGSNYFEIRFYK